MCRGIRGRDEVARPSARAESGIEQRPRHRAGTGPPIDSRAITRSETTNMRIADLTTGANQLRDALDVLQRAWSDTREKWHDANSQDVEENHLRPIARELATMFPAIDQLALILAQAERECQPW